MAQPNLITLTQPRAAAAEAIRALRTNLMFSRVDRPISTLLVTSAANADGKSELLANLAVTFAQAGHRTIVVDADLRRPSQHTIWGLPDAVGLGTMLVEAGALATPPLQATGVANLSVLTTGPLPPNPADVLSSVRMREIIGVLQARADYVLFDAPPVLAVTDAALLATQLDAVLLVLRAGHTRRDHASRTREALARVQAHVAGVALTEAPRERGRRYG